MAENEQKSVDQNNTAEQKDVDTNNTEEKLRNRQINYGIIRAMWRACNKNSTSGLYENLNMHTNVYTQIIKGNPYTFGKTQKEFYSNLKWIDSDYILGEKSLEDYMKDYIEVIWKSYAQALKNYNANNKKNVPPIVNDVEAAIQKIVRVNSRKKKWELKADDPIDRLFYFCLYKKVLVNVDRKFESLKDVLDNIENADWAECVNNKLLNELRQSLNSAYKNANTVYEYRVMTGKIERPKAKRDK